MNQINYKDILYYSKCSCGAITLHMSDNKTSYSCKEDTLKIFLPNLDLITIERLQNSYCCDHCVNHYGLDLCGCGSGEEYFKCTNGFDVCGKPMQVFNEYACVKAQGCWV